MINIILIILLILFIFSIINLILLNIPTACNYIYFHKEWKTWKYFIKNADKFEFAYIADTIKVYTWKEYRAIIWADGLCSIHDNNSKCIAISTNEKLSKQMARKLDMLTQCKTN